MKKRTYVYAQHGWACDSSPWETWHQYLPEDWVFETAERGYFGTTPKHTPMWPLDPNARRVVVAHSLGLHLVAPEILRMADALVIISGFKRFHITDNAASVRTIRRMQLRLRDDATGLLKDFYDQCYGKHSFEPSKPTEIPNPVGNILSNDLELLNTSIVTQSELACIPSVAILHGDNDAIVPAVHAIQLAELLPHNSTLSFCAGAEHALPFTHPAWCIERIKEMLADDNLEITVKMKPLSFAVKVR
jgi:pimeloyl-ACP methyl ester carboxylesterase